MKFRKNELILLAALGCAGAVRGGDVDLWSGFERHPAIVNSVNQTKGWWRVSLRGEWDFFQAGHHRVDRRNMSHAEFWRLREMPKGSRKIQVPGCWEAQGVGSPATSIPWKCWWDCGPKPLNHVYSGDGWYRKIVKLPSGWKANGRRVWIKVGGVNSQGWLWVNERQVAWLDSYCGTYKYDITSLVEEGQDVKVVCQVSNEVPSRRGLFNSINTWGGIVRDIELAVTPSTLIDDAWVRGDFDRREAEIHVELDGSVSHDMHLVATVDGATCDVSARAGENVLRVPLHDFKPWDPEHPNLYWADIQLLNGRDRMMSRRERFGVRKIEVRGRELYLNDKPFYVRGAGWHLVEPVKGCLPPDVDYFRERVRKVRAAGFNYVRCHTHCKWPEFYEAADELGLMVQPELPYYTDTPTDYFNFDPLRDAKELWVNYRRHASFAVYSGGNEGWYGETMTKNFYETVKAMDPDRLCMGQDCWDTDRTNQRGTSDLRGGPTRVWPRGSYDPDGPFLTHEYLNLCVKFDSRAADRFTGVWQAPISRKTRAEWLAKFGLDMELGDRLQNAQHAFQKVWQKRGFESARLDPYCDGYSFWSLQDSCSPQKGSYTGQALFDPFWGEKRNGQTAASLRVFNGPSCVLLDHAEKCVCTVGEKLPLRFLLAHYGDAALKDAKLKWKFTSGTRQLLAGELPIGDQALGAVREVGRTEVAIPAVDAACKATLEVEIAGGDAAPIRNAWDFWIFPKGPSRREILAEASKHGIVVADEGSDAAKRALAEGRDLIALSNQKGPVDVTPGWWYMNEQMGVALLEHPALRHLPHDGSISPLLFRILKKGTKLPVADVAQKDLIVVGEGGENCYLYLAEKKRTDGKRQFMASGLDLTADLPESNAILRGLVEILSRH